MSIDLDWEIAEDPHRIGAIDIAVSIPKHISPEQANTLERVAHSCLIHNTLTHPPTISLELAVGS